VLLPLSIALSACGGSSNDEISLLSWRTAPDGPCIEFFADEPSVVDSLITDITAQKLQERDAFDLQKSAEASQDSFVIWREWCQNLGPGLLQSDYDFYFDKSEAFRGKAPMQFCQAWLLRNPQYR
jgi:hypothetical protein